MEDRGVRREAAHAAVDPAGQLAAGDPSPAQVVEPGALPGIGKLVKTGALGHAGHSRSSISDRARSATFAGVKPSALSTTSPGADAPNRSEEHTSEIQSLMRIPYAAFRLQTKTNTP